MKRAESFPIDYQTRELIPVRSLEIKGKYKDELEGILISGGEIKSRLKALRNEISDYYTQFLKNSEKDVEVVGFPLLGGAMYFYTALVSGEFDKIWFPQILGKTSSYEGTESTGKLSIKGYSQHELKRLKDKRILLVDDIIDTGRTLSKMVEMLKTFNPLEIKICCLLDKPSRRIKPIESQFTGFIIPDKFVVGYGLDFNSRYRDLGHIAILKPEMYK